MYGRRQIHFPKMTKRKLNRPLGPLSFLFCDFWYRIPMEYWWNTNGFCRKHLWNINRKLIECWWNFDGIWKNVVEYWWHIDGNCLRFANPAEADCWPEDWRLRFIFSWFKRSVLWTGCIYLVHVPKSGIQTIRKVCITALQNLASSFFRTIGKVCVSYMDLKH